MKKLQSITIRARGLRQKSTAYEDLVWQQIRNRQAGFKIVRQKPIMLQYYGQTVAFVADFFCAQARMIIEIDGSSHDDRGDYDALRTLLLLQKGLYLIRFTNEEVQNDCQRVVEAIRSRLASPLDPLSINGEGKSITEPSCKPFVEGNEG